MSREKLRLGEFVFAVGTGAFELALYYSHLVPYSWEVFLFAYFLIVGFGVGYAEWRARGRVGEGPVS